MVNLWLAIVIYCIGLGAVLYIRPSLMFMDNGAWKEFGYQRDVRHTLFPFWLFSVVWALISYTLAAVFSLSFESIESVGYAGAGAAVGIGSLGHADYDWEPEEAEEPPRRRGPGRPRKVATPYPLEAVAPAEAEETADTNNAKPRPGYYVLEEKPANSGGLRRYVYYGDKPPAY